VSHGHDDTDAAIRDTNEIEIDEKKERHTMADEENQANNNTSTDREIETCTRAQAKAKATSLSIGRIFEANLEPVGSQAIDLGLVTYIACARRILICAARSIARRRARNEP
jgi:hypothetical protein